MTEDLLFVSCDIVHHSAEADDVQMQRVSAINALVRAALESSAGHATWFSGGDGGHVAFAGSDAPSRAWALIQALRAWSTRAKVPLRIVASTGAGQRFPGADGRTDMVGPGLNLAAYIMQRAGADARVVVTGDFRTRAEASLPAAWSLHDMKTLAVDFGGTQPLWLLSLGPDFSSEWGEHSIPGIIDERDDRTRLHTAVESNDGLSVLYLAKRLLQTNRSDNDAVRALRQYMGPAVTRIGSSRMLAQLFADVTLGLEFIRASGLVERSAGDVLCRAGDDGTAMFLLLRGRLDGYLGFQGLNRPPGFHVAPGNLVGEMAFALGTQRSATLVCADACCLLAFDQEDLLSATSDTALLAHVRQVVQSIALTRVVQNSCMAASYLSGRERKGPLGSFDRPWIDLREGCRTIALHWRQNEVDFSSAEFQEPGLYLLVGGQLAPSEETVLDAIGAEPPILIANLPGNVTYRTPPCRILNEVIILFIAASAFDSFGPQAYRKIASEVRARTTVARASAKPATVVEDLISVGGAGQSVRKMDVVFVHGLDGDARTTWHPKGNPAAFWPAWLAEDVPGIAVWSLDYEASSSGWKGSTMPLADRATNALATLDAQGLGDRPIVFICHSLGGLVVKQMLRHGLDYATPAWKAIADQTRGIAFLSTPHSGSDLSNWISHLGGLLRATVTVDELRAQDPRLRELNTWFRNAPLTSRILVQAYCEKEPLAGVLVVDEVSADPGIQGVVLIPLPENHATICKPASRDKLVYQRVKKFVADLAQPLSTP